MSSRFPNIFFRIRLWCHGSVVQASAGFWGAEDINDGSVLLTYCPGGYCCELDTCSDYNICYGNRTGILCGECSPNYAESISSTDCVSIL